MEDSRLFLQWVTNTLQHQHPVTAPPVNDHCGENTFASLQALREVSRAAQVVHAPTMEAHATNSWSSGDGSTTDSSSVVACISAPTAMEQDTWSQSPNSATARPVLRGSKTFTNLPMSWNFSSGTAPPGSDGVPVTAVATQGLPELGNGGSPPTRRSGFRTTGSISTSYAQDHIIAERKRREKINQRFIELSTVIPGLKKMDKATILSDATRYVKELQKKLKSMEDDGSNGRSITESVVLLVKKPCIKEPDRPVEDDSPSWASSITSPVKKPLPEIEAQVSEKSVMMKIHCDDGKGVVVRMLAEVEELHLSIINANVMPFPACTLIITIMAKVEQGFTITAQDIVARLNTAFNSTEATEN
ncbi:hypothetical protein ACP4OV_013437 [Aristida adscensionis]